MKVTVTYWLSPGYILIGALDDVLKANPSDLLLVLGFTFIFTVHGILLLFINLNLSLTPFGFLLAIIVPNQKTFSTTP